MVRLREDTQPGTSDLFKKFLAKLALLLSSKTAISKVFKAATKQPVLNVHSIRHFYNAASAALNAFTFDVYLNHQHSF